MGRISKRKIDQEIQERILELFWRHLSSLNNKNLTRNFLSDLLSPTELSMLSKRLAIAVLLAKKFNYQQIDEIIKVSKSTISTIDRQLSSGASGYKYAVGQILKKEKSEKLLVKIDELLIQFSPKKMYGSAAWKQKSFAGKIVVKRKKQLKYL